MKKHPSGTRSVIALASVMASLSLKQSQSNSMESSDGIESRSEQSFDKDTESQSSNDTPNNEDDECIDDDDEDLSDDDDEIFADEDMTDTGTEISSFRADTGSTNQTAVGAEMDLRDKLKSPIWTSSFKDGDSVLYFPCPDETVGALGSGLSSMLKWKVNKGSPRVIRNALKSANFKLVKTGDSWIGYWGKHWVVEKYKNLLPYQRINHFPMSFEIGRKDKMYVNNMALLSRAKDQENYLPETHMLPRYRRQLKRAFSKHPLWIIKPPANARGNGIKVISKWSDLPKKKSLICSRYIANPFLVNNRKFDLRLYVLVSSFDPIRIYLYKDGLVRFAAEPYKHGTLAKTVKNRFIHLTNYSVSKKNKIPFEETGVFGIGSKFSMADNKWTLSTLFEYLEMQGVDHLPVMERIRSLIIKTMMSVHTSNTSGTRLYVPNSASCFELFGFDVLLDATLKPWLMEVNISPSMKASCDLDFAIKSKLARDMLNLVGVRLKDIQLAKQMTKSKNPASIWTKTLLTSSERLKQRRVMIDGLLPLSGLTQDDLRKLQEVEDEYNRRGEFDRLYPSHQYGAHSKYLASFNYCDRLLMALIEKEPIDTKRVQLLRKLAQTPEIFSKDTRMPPRPLPSPVPSLMAPSQSKGYIPRVPPSDSRLVYAPLIHSDTNTTLRNSIARPNIQDVQFPKNVKTIIVPQQAHLYPNPKESLSKLNSGTLSKPRHISLRPQPPTTRTLLVSMTAPIALAIKKRKE